jgi:hypothetical protein
VSRFLQPDSSFRLCSVGDLLPSPVGCGEPGSKIGVLSEAAGLPLVVGVSAAKTNDSYALNRW